jgi:hypothetical protein
MPDERRWALQSRKWIATLVMTGEAELVAGLKAQRLRNYYPVFPSRFRHKRNTTKRHFDLQHIKKP